MKEINKDIINACKRKDRTAQKAVYQVLLPYLKPIAKRYLRNNQYVQDVLQESFVKIFLDINQFSEDKGNLLSWASKITINKSLNYNNRIIGLNKQNIESLEISETFNLNDEKTIDKKSLNVILQKMPKGYFEVFNLYVIDGYDHLEISEILDITPALSRKKLSRARAWFKNSEFIKKIVMFLFLIQLIY